MNGKNKCKILKDIRRQIAENNDIAYVTTECKYQGECSGTCPKCEAEVRYLEEELQKRQKAGKALAVAGIAAALMVNTAGCMLNSTDENLPLAGEPLPPQTTAETTEPNSTETDPTQMLITGEAIDVTTMGEPVYSELQGDIALP